METQELGRSLVEAYRWVPDPRAARGRRHPLAAILALVTTAMLEGAQSLYAIHQWGRLQSAEVLAGWSQAAIGDGVEAIAVDGKALRGSHSRSATGITVDVVAAYAHGAGQVLAQSGGRGM